MNTAAISTTRLLPWMIYPAVMVLCLVLHAAMLRAGITLQIATLVPVILGAASITLLERVLPHDSDWQARWPDVREDLLFMLFIQVALPRVFAVLVVLAVAGTVSGTIPPSYIWPHHWPVTLQAVLMLVSADFMRYWLHRLAHENAFLWRFHAVHHSPHKLYWLNVGRFHPVDKALQFLLDAMPFILLGVSEPVLSLYFVFYAVNGFFQHSNVHMKFGLLNYIISSAELHRWHHSRVPEESNTNYGNNLILWDVIFGTRFLPSDREIHDLGLKDPHYPVAFLKQMLVPVLIDRAVFMSTVKNSLINFFLLLRMKFIEMVYWRPLLKATHQPRRVQVALLQDILQHNESTRYGEEHGFADIHDYASFCRQVPANDYEDLHPYIDEQEATGMHALINEAVVMYATTSGTTAKPKLLPISARMLRDYKRNQAIFSYMQYRHRPAAFKGRYLGIVGGATEGHTARGTPFGSISGVLNQTMPRLTRQKYVTPPGIFELKDYSLKYYLILRLSLMHQNLSYIVCANPSTLLKLEALINADLRLYVEEIDKGTLRDLPALDELPKNLHREINERIHPQPERAVQLADLYSNVPNVYIRDVWPELAMITTWKGGSCSVALKSLEQSVTADTVISDPGYLSSEFRGTFTWNHETGAGIPTMQDNFSEFVSVTDWDENVQRFLTLEQLEESTDYYVFITTRGGLYRYHMNDIVRVEGFLNRTPLLRFLQKGRGVTNITGEKLYESQVIDAVAAALRHISSQAPFYLMTADRTQAVYRLYLELVSSASIDVKRFSSVVDEQLCRINLEYKAKRSSGRLAPLEVILLQSGACECYKEACVRRGQKESQYKTVILQYQDELLFDFTECLQ